MFKKPEFAGYPMETFQKNIRNSENLVGPADTMVTILAHLCGPGSLIRIRNEPTSIGC